MLIIGSSGEFPLFKAPEPRYVHDLGHVIKPSAHMCSEGYGICPVLCVCVGCG